MRLLTVRGEAYATLDETYTEQDALTAFTSGLMAATYMLAPSGERGILVELLACGFGR